MGLLEDIEKRKQERRELIKREGPDRETFLHWRSPRFGTSNPEELTNPFWCYAIKEGGSGWSFKEDFDGPDSFDAGPCFSFQRYGRAEINLPDGRQVLIGGTHEDFIDPDFCIYNDVVIRDGERITIYGYPDDIFPPTDYATATLVGDEIWIIGCLGYKESRDERPTQVRVLNTNNWSIRTVQCQGDDPGTIWGHQAEISSDGSCLLISGGERHCRVLGMEARSLTNPNIHLLNLATHTWSLIDREAECQYWCLTPKNQGILNRSPHRDSPDIPTGNRLAGTLCKGKEDLCFRLPIGRLDEHILQITVQNYGRYATATMQGPLQWLAINQSHIAQELLDDLIIVLENHFACGPLQAQLIERAERADWFKFH